MTKLLIVRHGQTVWNTMHKMQGQNDSPLTETGRELARRLALRLQGVPVDGVISSPIKRAADTAAILADALKLPVTADDRLRELALGKWEGEDMRTIESRYPIDFEWFWQDPNRYIEMRGGESYDALCARTADFMREMAKREGTYVVVTHAIALRTMRQYVLGLNTESSRMSMPSCCLCQVNIENGKYDLMLFGDRYHHDDSIRSWWHGSPEKLTTLRPGSTITRIRPLAEAFSHKPSLLGIGTDSSIVHNGTRPAYLYRVSEEVRPGDVMQHPRTTMPQTYEFLTSRELKVELVCETDADAQLTMPADDPELTLKI